jgi:hypothetical protein
MSIEEIVAEKLRELPKEKQQEVLRHGALSERSASHSRRSHPSIGHPHDLVT